MKKLFLMFIFLSAIVSCGGETKETNKCDGVSCNEWEQCNATSGVCEAKSGRCNANRDCSGTNICDANHNCVNPDNPCENRTCSSHGTCVVENNSAKCNCETGFVADGLNCIADLCSSVTCDEWKQCNPSNGACVLKTGRCNSDSDCSGDFKCDENHTCYSSTNPCENQTCSAHGTCVVENNSAKCNCETGFVANGLSCEEKLCEEEAGQYISCGEDGEKQHQICTNNQWINDGSCKCANSTTRRTTCQGDGLQYQTCVDGSWADVGTCINTDCSTAGETRAVGCGFNGIGVQNQVCVNSKWTNTGTCTDPDECGNGTTQLVANDDCEEQSLNGRGKAEQICANGQWIDYEGNCKDPDICEDDAIETIEGNCGINNEGTKYKKCVAGQWDFKDEYCLIYNTKIWGTNSSDNGNSVAVDSSGNVFVTGSTLGGLDGNTNSNPSCTGTTTSNCEDIFLTKFDNFGNKLWTKQWGTERDDMGNSVAIDSSGNVFVTGYYNTNIFIIKFDNEGSEVWTYYWGNSYNDVGNSVAIDNSGNVFVTGYTGDGLDGNTNAGNYDIFLTKFDNNGNKLWTKQWGTTEDDRGNSVAVDNSGKVFVTGYTIGGLDGNTNSGYTCDIFLTKFDNEGNKQWTKQWGTNGHAYGESVSVDNLGSIFISGYTEGGLDGNTNSGYDDIFLTKFDNNGNKLFTKQWGTTHFDEGNSVSVDSSGNVFVTGQTRGGLDGNNTSGGDTDIFLTKFDNAGTKLWTKQWGSTSWDYSNSVAIDSSGNVFVTGWTGGSSNLGSNVFLTIFEAE